MTTANLFSLLAAFFFVAGLYLVCQRGSGEWKRGKSPRPLKHRPAGILSLVLAALSLTVAVVTNSSTVSLPEVDTNTVIPEGGRFPLPAPVEASADSGMPDPAEALRHQRKLDAELVQLNIALEANPRDVVSLGNRGSIYAEKKSWELAENDFRAALNVDGKLAKAAFDLAEMEFQQKKYDSARPGFLALEGDPNLGDLATYKVFLCDLLGGHEDLAQKELNDLNQSEGDASYYYSNVAWLLVHHKPAEAREWLDSATYIYSVPKAELYTTSLTDLGYLPIPPSQ